MSESHGAKQNREGLDARHDDPQIGVHVMTEFIFCPRAGLLSYEQQVEEEELERKHYLNFFPFLPRWNLQQIEKSLSQELMLFWLSAFALIASLFLVRRELAIGVSFDRLNLQLGVGAVAVISLYFLLTLVQRVLVLMQRRKAAKDAKPEEPDPDSPNNQPVNWWNLLKAGYDSIPYEEKLHDERWRFAGNIKRVLRKGGLRVPVFRLRRNVRHLYRQHYARMAAYCHLLEVCEGAESPFGVILFEGSFDGITVPNNSASQAAFYYGLREARKVIRQQRDRGSDPPSPERENICAGCKHGFPRVHRPKTKAMRCAGIPVPANITIGVDSRRYHSDCGDRFGWTPPHERMHEKELW